MNAHATPLARGRGLSLIELLVAVALGGILMGGAITLFINNRATYEVTNDMARLQENARFALQLMTEDLRMAGYVGCVNDFTKVSDTVTGGLSGIVEGDLGSFAHAIEAIDNGGANWLPSGFVGGAPFFQDSDAITVRYFDGDRTLTGTDPENEVINESPKDANPDNPVLLVRAMNFSAPDGQLFSVSDCGSADVFTVAATGTDAGTGADTLTASTLTRSYESINRALVAPAVAVRYYVQTNAAGQPALYRSTLTDNDPSTANTAELVDGVQTLQVLYGVDTDQDGLPNRFLSPGDTLPDVSDPSRTVSLVNRNDFLSIVAIKIALLMRTVDEFGDVPEDVVYDVGEERFCRDGLTAVPACTKTFTSDRRRRRVFQTTIAVRNFQ